MLHSQKKEKKKAAGSSEPTKETRFIHKVTHIHKNELRRGSYQPPPILPPPQNPSKHLSLAPLLNQEFGSPLEVPSPLKIQSDPQSSSKLEHLSIPLRTHLFLFHHPQAAVLMFPDFSRIAGNLTPSVCWGWDKGDWVYAFHNLKLARPA